MYIRDPILGDVEISDEVKEIVDHPLFQRLRNVSQLGLTHLIYPTARHTRFDHSIGVYHITRHATDDERIQVYALLHDLGHGPFSHQMEIALRMNGYEFDHEKRGEELAKGILQDSTYSFSEVFRNRGNQLVYGGIGTDRMDYLMRDSYFTGIRIGLISWERMCRNMYLDGGKLYIKRKVLPNVEHLYVARFILFDTVYGHKTKLIIDTLLSRVVRDLLQYYSPEELLSMDEASFIAAARKIGSTWWKRIEERKLFKMIFRGDKEEAEEVYEKLSSKYGEDSVVLWMRSSYYSRPDVYLEDGTTVIQASPLIRSLRRSEEERTYWFVAVDPLKIPLP